MKRYTLNVAFGIFLVLNIIWLASKREIVFEDWMLAYVFGAFIMGAVLANLRY